MIDKECNIIFSDKFGDIYKIESISILEKGYCEISLLDGYYEFKEEGNKLARYV